jgi:Holliday junction resolvase RusA-like endonuclease
MKPIEIFIPGVPVGKGRPRMTRGGIAYTPARTRAAERRIAAALAAARLVVTPLEGPLDVMLDFRLPVPQSWPVKRREMALNGVLSATTRPDLDNLIKLVYDACNGRLWEDDKQIVSATAKKRYAASPGVHIMVRCLYD